MTDQERFHAAINAADSIIVDGPKFRAMVEAMMLAAPDMLHRHVVAINLALATAKPHPMPEPAGDPLC
jgi:hypothetical protein